jgi:trans-aconitate 2-methyltransferase
VKQDWNADDYARNSSAQEEWAQELIAKLSLNGSESLIDIGCGDGKITALIAQILPEGKVLGIDMSRDMIGLASKKFTHASHPNLSFMQMDATYIRLRETFDIAFSNAVLHWIADQPSVLRGVHSCLRPGGRILFQMGGRGNAQDVFLLIQEIIKRHDWKKYFEGFTPPYYFHGPEEYRLWLEKSGFRIKRVELIPKDMQHQGKKWLKGWLRTTWFPYTNRLPAELRDIFLDEVIKEYTTKHPLDDHGNTHVKMVRLEVEAYTP